MKEQTLDAQLNEKSPVATYLDNNKISSISSTLSMPHTSKERMIGCCRRILNALLLQNKQDLTHVVLSIFMLDVCTFLYAQPLVSVSSDQDKPEVISTCQLLIKSSLNDFDLSSCHQKDDIRN